MPSGLLAEVYTYPRFGAGAGGDIVLSVEAEVTMRNCGQEIEAQALETQQDGRIQTKNMALAVPACDAVGNFLVLNNLLQDMKIAAR